jgi:PPOX class probable F420-dependent enzyme
VSATRLLTDQGRQFVTDRHLATMVTVRADGSPHAVPVGFTYRDGIVRVITRGGSVKAANARRQGRAAVSQVDGGRWLTFEGTIAVSDDPDRVALAVQLYAVRYRQPQPRPDRVVLEITVDRILGSANLLTPGPPP